MKVYEHPNTYGGWKCPICRTDDDKPVVLIDIYGTQEGNKIKAEQFHIDCIDLVYYPNKGIIAMNVGA